MESIAAAMTIELPDLIVDSREPEEVYQAIVNVLKGKIVTRETLPSDYIIPPSDTQKGWIIERKQSSDFVNTWLGDRLGDQLSVLKEFQSAGEYRGALMLVGNPVVSRKKGSKMNPIAIQNMIVGVKSKWDIDIIPVYSEWLMPFTLKYLIEGQVGKKAFVNPRSGASREASPKDQAVYVAAGFPGMGPKTLEKVRGETSCLVHFITKCLNVNLDSLTENQMTKINRVLNENWSVESK